MGNYILFRLTWLLRVIREFGTASNIASLFKRKRSRLMTLCHGTERMTGIVVTRGRNNSV
jgi:hypothetical protein